MSLSLNTTTGEIDLSNSTPGTYTIRYTTREGSVFTQVTVQQCDSESEGEEEGGEGEGG